MTEMAADGAASPTAPDDDDLDLSADEIAVVAVGLISIRAVAEVLGKRFSADDAWTLVMRAATATLNEVIDSNAAPQQIEAIEATLSRKLRP